MITPLLSLVCIAAPQATQASSLEVLSASLFKNGYAVTVRQAPLTGPETMIQGLPSASLGTFWITASPGTNIEEVVRTEVETKNITPLASFEEIITANVGKQVSVALSEALAGQKAVEGKILALSGNVLMIQADKDTVAVPKAAILSLKGEALEWKRETTTKQIGLRVKAKIPANTRPMLYIVALERGLMWAPAYAIDITDKAKLSITMRSTILNDLAELKAVELKLITGFPNIPYLNVPDPFTSGVSVDQFVGALLNIGTEPALRGGGAQMGQNAMKADRRPSFDAGFDVTDVGSMQAEDLFFYKLQKVTLKRGERSYSIVMKSESPYEHLYTWSIPDSIADTLYKGAQEGPGDVWHSLKFKNSSGQPWTTAPATTVQNGEILGQDLMHYTSAGADAIVKITKALDIRADQFEEEIERQRGALRIHPQTGPVYDLITLKATLEVTNRKAEKVKLRIDRELTGEVVEAQGNPTLTKIAKGLKEINPKTRLEWTKEIDPGQKLTLTFSYKVYVSQ